MADGTQVEKCNSELKSILEDMKGARHDPFLIRVTESLVKLTGSPEDAAAIEEANAPDPKEVKRKELAAQIAALQKQAASL